jgi:glycosyltransferase involved in cell wall biosynthesis
MRNPGTIPRVLVAYYRPHGGEKFFNGKYAIDEGQSSTSKSPCSYLGLATALQGDYRSIQYVDSSEKFKGYDVVIAAVSSLDDTARITQWIRHVKSWSPKTIFIGQSEASLANHAISSRDWRFQKTFYEFCQEVDEITTFTKETIPYFSLFSRKVVKYLPHLYPLHFVEANNLHKNRSLKEQILFKNGHIHGRLLCDGFADLALLSRIQSNHPAFRIAFVDSPASFVELLSDLDYVTGSFDQPNYLKKTQLAFKKSLLNILRFHRKTSDAFRQRSSLRNEFPLVLRGTAEESILKRPFAPWIENIRYMSSTLLMLDMDHSFAVGRSFADAVAVGTPTIGVNSDFQKQLLPELSVSEHDYSSAEALIERLLSDEEYYEEMSRKGRDRLEKFRYESGFSWLRSCVGERWRWENTNS